MLKAIFCYMIFGTAVLTAEAFSTSPELKALGVPEEFKEEQAETRSWPCWFPWCRSFSTAHAHLQDVVALVNSRTEVINSALAVGGPVRDWSAAVVNGDPRAAAISAASEWAAAADLLAPALNGPPQLALTLVGSFNAIFYLIYGIRKVFPALEPEAAVQIMEEHQVGWCEKGLQLGVLLGRLAAYGVCAGSAFAGCLPALAAMGAFASAPIGCALGHVTNYDKRQAIKEFERREAERNRLSEADTFLFKDVFCPDDWRADDPWALGVAGVGLASRARPSRGGVPSGQFHDMNACQTNTPLQSIQKDLQAPATCVATDKWVSEHPGHQNGLCDHHTNAMECRKSWNGEQLCMWVPAAPTTNRGWFFG